MCWQRFTDSKRHRVALAISAAQECALDVSAPIFKTRQHSKEASLRHMSSCRTWIQPCVQSHEGGYRGQWQVAEYLIEKLDKGMSEFLSFYSSLLCLLCDGVLMLFSSRRRCRAAAVETEQS